MDYSTQTEGKSTTIRVVGELDAVSVTELRPSLDAIAAAEPRSVTVDLSGLRLIDSSGVGALVSLFKRVRASGGQFEVKGVQGQPMSIFKVLRLDKVFSVG
jgi:anti-sigma B factor antagonist